MFKPDCIDFKSTILLKQNNLQENSALNIILKFTEDSVLLNYIIYVENPTTAEMEKQIHDYKGTWRIDNEILHMNMQCKSVLNGEFTIQELKNEDQIQLKKIS